MEWTTIPSDRGLFVVRPRSHLRTSASTLQSLSVSDRSPFSVRPLQSWDKPHTSADVHDGEVKRGHLHVTADGADGSGTVIFATPTKSGAASFSHDPGNRTLLLNTIRSAKPLPLCGRPRLTFRRELPGPGGGIPARQGAPVRGYLRGKGLFLSVEAKFLRPRITFWYAFKIFLETKLIQFVQSIVIWTFFSFFFFFLFFQIFKHLFCYSIKFFFFSSVSIFFAVYILFLGRLVFFEWKIFCDETREGEEERTESTIHSLYRFEA